MSTRSLGTLTLDLVMKTGMFEQGMDRAARLADRKSKEIERSAKGIGIALGAAFGGVATAVGLVVNNTVKSQQELAQLDAILKSTGNAAGLTRDQLVGMADALQDKSTFSSGAIIEAQTRLLSYSGVLGENIPRAMQTIIDQSARLGLSLTQSAETIGRALESPSKAAAALSQQGFGAAFTEEVRGTIDALVAAGREAEAQVMILEILEESYAGAAEAARNTLGGALSALKNNLADLMTGGEGSLDGATKAINDLIDALNDPKFRRDVDDLISKIFAFGSAVASNFGEAQRWISIVINSLGVLKTELAGVELQYRSWSPMDGIRSLFTGGSYKDPYVELLERRNQVAKEGAEYATNLSNAWNRVKTPGPLMEMDFTRGAPLDPRARPNGANPEKPKKSGKSEAEREADSIRRAYESAMDSAKERLALIGVESELARNLYQLHEGSLKALDPQRKAELEQIYQQIDARQMLNDALAKEEKAREKERKRVEDAMKAGKELLADLQFELELMRLTNAERATAIQLRGLDAEAVAEYGERIAAANKQIEDSMRQIELMDGFRDSFSNFFQDVIGGTKSVKDAFTDMLDNINRMIMQRVADNLVEKLFGSFGTSQSGSAGGGWMSTFASWFGGGKAGGGWAHANSVYEVNERGMEMATVNGRDYLLTGNKSVKITPNHQVGGGGQMITNNLTVQGRIDRRSEQRIAREIGQKTRMATARV